MTGSPFYRQKLWASALLSGGLFSFPASKIRCSGKDLYFSDPDLFALWQNANFSSGHQLGHWVRKWSFSPFTLAPNKNLKTDEEGREPELVMVLYIPLMSTYFSQGREGFVDTHTGHSVRKWVSGVPPPLHIHERGNVWSKSEIAQITSSYFK